MKKTKTKFCPKCGGTDITMAIGGITGEWKCRKCNYTSSIFPEKIKNMQKK